MFDVAGNLETHNPNVYSKFRMRKFLQVQEHSEDHKGRARTQDCDSFFIQPLRLFRSCGSYCGRKLRVLCVGVPYTHPTLVLGEVQLSLISFEKAPCFH